MGAGTASMLDDGDRRRYDSGVSTRTTMRNIALISRVVLLGLLTFSCTWGRRIVLEYADVQNFALTEKVSEGITSLQVSGLAFHSALAVERMVTEVQADTLCMKLVLVP